MKVDLFDLKHAKLLSNSTIFSSKTENLPSLIILNNTSKTFLSFLIVKNVPKDGYLNLYKKKKIKIVRLCPECTINLNRPFILLNSKMLTLDES